MDEGQSILWGGIGVLLVNLLVLGSVYIARSKRPPHPATPSIATAAGWALFAVGFARSVRGTYAWAHDDDVVAMIATAIGLLWATSDASLYLYAAIFSNEKSQNPGVYWAECVYRFFGVLAQGGGWAEVIMLCMRGRETADARMVLAGGIMAFLGLHARKFFYDSELNRKQMFTFAALVVLEAAGLLLLASGVTAHTAIDPAGGYNL